MSDTRLGRTLIIANPTSHSGRGAAGAQSVQRFFEVYEAATSGFELRLTEAPGDAQVWAADAAGFDTVIALGGDGIIHEVVNGLMALADAARPRLGVIPLGSGNDFARTLGLTLNNPDRSLAELLAGRPRLFDVGHVASDAVPEGCYFAETLSFGLDAAIAIDTTVRRAQGTSQQGAGLFLTSSLRLLATAAKAYPCRVRFDGGGEQGLSTLILAIQNGPTYGGGFRICPAADPTDGRLDLCYNTRKPWLPHLFVLLGLARFGRHGGSRAVQLAQARRVELAFGDAVPPCQVDGEEFAGTRFEVAVVPQALRVIVPPANRW